MDYRKRESYHFYDLLYQSPKFELGQLAKVNLRCKKSKSFLNLGQTSSDASLNLRNLVTHINESMKKKDPTLYKGIKIEAVQLLSEQHRIIDISVPSDMANTSISAHVVPRFEPGFLHAAT